MIDIKTKKKTYAEKLKDPRWQKKRLKILERDGFKCSLCEDEKTTLHVHHKKYNGDPWEALDEDLQVACEHCHGFIEWLKKSQPWMPEYIENIYKQIYYGVGDDQLIQFILDMGCDIQMFDMEIFEGEKEYREQNNIGASSYPTVLKIMEDQRERNNG